MLHVVPAGILSFPSGGYEPAGGLYLDGSADYLTFTPSPKDKVVISSVIYQIIKVLTEEQKNTAVYYVLFLRS